jgi:hypothetical protein
MSSFCAGCGNSLSEADTFCPICGRNLCATSATPALDPAIAFGLSPETSGKAIFSFVCGIFCLFPPTAIVAVIFGHLSLSEIRRSAGRLAGKGLAITGLVLGYAGVALTAVLVIMIVVAIPRVRNHGLTPRVTSNEPSAVSAVRTLNTAEIAYAQAHPTAGYTCSLSELSGAWGINGALAQVKNNGYMVALQECAAEKSGGPVTKYQVVAYPAPTGKAKLPAFCSNQSDEIKMDWNGSPQGCLSQGVDLTETEINHPKGWTPKASH